MKFTAASLLAITTCIFSAKTLASPINPDDSLSAVAVREPIKMTVADKFSNSGLEYMDWANKMVDEGKMRWPNTTSTKTLVTRTGTFSIKNLACGILIGGETNWVDSRNRVCNYFKGYISAVWLGMEYIITDEICDDGDTCLFLAEISFGVGGAFVQDGFNTICDPIFELINEDCAGYTGGSAQIQLQDSAGSFPGIVESMFYADDTGTCPATSNTFQCAVGSAN